MTDTKPESHEIAVPNGNEAWFDLGSSDYVLEGDDE